MTDARTLAQGLACGRCSINAGDKIERTGFYIQGEGGNYSKTLLIMMSHAFYLIRLNMLRSLMRMACKNSGEGGNQDGVPLKPWWVQSPSICFSGGDCGF